jgi:hypothetical protein
MVAMEIVFLNKLLKATENLKEYKLVYEKERRTRKPSGL